MSSFAYPEGTVPVSSKPAVCAKIRGVGTAIVTPFAGENAATVDYDSLTNLVDAQLAGGLDFIVPVGTTGWPGWIAGIGCTGYSRISL